MTEEPGKSNAPGANAILPAIHLSYLHLCLVRALWSNMDRACEALTTHGAVMPSKEARAGIGDAAKRLSHQTRRDDDIAGISAAAPATRTTLDAFPKQPNPPAPMAMLRRPRGCHDDSHSSLRNRKATRRA